ncbi:MAG: hypothetical protein ACLTAF_15180, partial [Blautia coccoides]
QPSFLEFPIFELYRKLLLLFGDFLIHVTSGNLIWAKVCLIFTLNFAHFVDISFGMLYHKNRMRG